MIEGPEIRPTVRGETDSPSFRSSSFAIRSSPTSGSRGHRDDQPLQVDWNRRPAGAGLPPPEESPALSVPPDEVSGLTTVSIERQSSDGTKRPARLASRVGPPGLRPPLGTTPAARRNRFSAASWALDVSPRRTSTKRSASKRAIVENKEDPRLDMAAVS